MDSHSSSEDEASASKPTKPADNSGSFYEFEQLCGKLLDEPKYTGKVELMKEYIQDFT
jgi:hypothetical protein